MRAREKGDGKKSLLSSAYIKNLLFVFLHQQPHNFDAHKLESPGYKMDNKRTSTTANFQRRVPDIFKQKRLFIDDRQEGRSFSSNRQENKVEEGREYTDKAKPISSKSKDQDSDYSQQKRLFMDVDERRDNPDKAKSDF